MALHGMPLAYTVASPECYARPAMAYEAPLSTAIQELQRLGYEGVEVQTRDVRELDRSAIADDMDRAGMRLAVLATGPLGAEGLGLAHTDGSPERQETLARLEALVDWAAEVGAIISLGRSLGGGNGDRQQRLDLMAAGLASLDARAADRGVQIALEPQNQHLTDLLRSIADTREVIERVGGSTLGVLADTYHLALEEASVEAGLVEAAPHLMHVQFSDSNRRRAGAGTLPFTSIVRVLQLLGYRGWVGLEHRQEGQPEELAGAASRFVHALA